MEVLSQDSSSGTVSDNVEKPVEIKGDHPLAVREIKRRRITDFIYDTNSAYSWHPSPQRYVYPPRTVFLPPPQIQLDYFQSPVISTVKKNLPKIAAKPPTPFQPTSFSSRRGMKKRKDIDLDFTIPPSSEEETSPILTKSKSIVDDHTLEGGMNINVKQIIQAIKNLGGKGTGAEITAWIDKHCADTSHNKKRLGYTVNSVLSAKKYSILFAKETVIIDGNKRALWKLASGHEQLAFDDMIAGSELGGPSEETSPAEMKSSKEEEVEEKDVEEDVPKILEFGGIDQGIATDEEPETDLEERSLMVVDSSLELKGEI